MTKIKNLYSHISYGSTAAIKFFDRWFRVPLHTTDGLESRRRFDIAASQLADFFEEPRALLVPEFGDEYAKVVLVNRVWDDTESDVAEFDPRVKNQAAYEAERDRFPKESKWVDFLWCLRRTQLQVEKYCKSLGIDLYELHVKRQALLKRWPEELKLREAKESFGKMKKVDGALHYVKCIAAAPKNFGTQLVYAQKTILSLQYLKAEDRIRLTDLFDKAVPLVQALDAKTAEILKAATSACLAIRNYSE